MREKADAPLYRELADYLRGRIRDGSYSAGAQIPTESALCLEHAVSRTTVRQAVQELVNEGVLDRQQGRGTFVAPPTARRNDFYRPLHNEKMSFALVESGFTMPSFELASAFAVSTGESLFSMTRLRLDHGVPVGVTRYFSSALIFQTNPLRDDELTSVPFDGILASRGVRSFRSNILAEPVTVEEQDADLLSVPPGARSIATQRIGFNEIDRAVRLSRTVMRPDRARLFWSMRHGASPSGQREISELSVWTTSELD
jgi:GntR family transcriptional regulator